MKLIINTDGGGVNGTLDNQSQVAFAFVARLEDGTYVASLNDTLERGSTNDAEYSGVLLALESLPVIALQLGRGVVTSVEFHTDSQLIHGQITGRCKCKQENLQALLSKVKERLARIKVPVKFVWERREHNSEADYLCHLALEGTILTDPFAPLRVKERKTTRSVSAGQLFRIGKLTEPRSLRVDIEGFALCGSCRARVTACSCPPLEEAA